MKPIPVSITITLTETSQGKWGASVRREERGNSYALQTFRNTRWQAKAWAMRIAGEELDESRHDEGHAA